MISYEVVFAPRAIGHVESIRRYIAERASPDIANAYVDRLLDRCRTLDVLPQRGRPRPDLGRGLRSMSFKRRANVVFRVKARTVEILAIGYAGQELRPLLR